MSNSVILAPNAGVQDLARTVMSRLDQDNNGQLSHQEFANFLESFVRQLAGPRATSLDRPAAAVQGAAASSPSDALPPVMAGWDHRKWLDGSHTTVKYVAGRVLARFNPGEWLDGGRREEILSALRTAGLNPTPVGIDKVDFNDGFGPVDIVQGARVGGRAWQWLSTP